MDHYTNQQILKIYEKIITPVSDLTAYSIIFISDLRYLSIPNPEEVIATILRRAGTARRLKVRLQGVAEAIRTVKAQADAYKIKGELWLSDHRNINALKRLVNEKIKDNIKDLPSYIKNDILARRSKFLDPTRNSESLQNFIQQWTDRFRNDFILRQSIRDVYCANNVPETEDFKALLDKLVNESASKVVRRKCLQKIPSLPIPSVMKITADQVLEFVNTPNAPEYKLLLNIKGAPFSLIENGIKTAFRKVTWTRGNMIHDNFYLMMPIHYKYKLERLYKNYYQEQNEIRKREAEEFAIVARNVVNELTPVIRAIFPKITEEVLECVVRHTTSDANRIGMADDVSLEDRAFFAVWAHLRHQHTSYEKILTSLWDSGEHYEFGSVNHGYDSDGIAKIRKEEGLENKRIARKKIRPQMDRLVQDLGCTYQPTQDIDGYYSEKSSFGMVG